MVWINQIKTSHLHQCTIIMLFKHTHFGVSSVPPQKWPLFFCKDAIHGQAPFCALSPSTIRLCWTDDFPQAPTGPCVPGGCVVGGRVSGGNVCGGKVTGGCVTPPQTPQVFLQ